MAKVLGGEKLWGARNELKYGRLSPSSALTSARSSAPGIFPLLAQFAHSVPDLHGRKFLGSSVDNCYGRSSHMLLLQVFLE